MRSAASTQLLRTFRRSSWASYGRSLRCCTATLVGSSEICTPPPWCQLLPWSPRQRGPASRGMHGASACLGMDLIRCPLLRQKCTASLWRPRTLKSPETLKRPTSGGALKLAQLAGALHRWCSGVQMRWLRAREGAESWLMPRDGHLFEWKVWRRRETGGLAESVRSSRLCPRSSSWAPFLSSVGAIECTCSKHTAAMRHDAEIHRIRSSLERREWHPRTTPNVAHFVCSGAFRAGCASALAHVFLYR